MSEVVNGSKTIKGLIDQPKQFNSLRIKSIANWSVSFLSARTPDLVFQHQAFEHIWNNNHVRIDVNNFINVVFIICLDELVEFYFVHSLEMSGAGSVHTSLGVGALVLASRASLKAKLFERIQSCIIFFLQKPVSRLQSSSALDFRAKWFPKASE